MKMTICKNNRIFEISACSIGSGMADVTIYEVVRPKWKIFRTNFLPFYSSSFFVIDYSSIYEGCVVCLDKALQKEEEQKEISKKWKEFEKPIDKIEKV